MLYADRYLPRPANLLEEICIASRPAKKDLLFRLFYVRLGSLLWPGFVIKKERKKGIVR